MEREDFSLMDSGWWIVRCSFKIWIKRIALTGNGKRRFPCDGLDRLCSCHFLYFTHRSIHLNNSPSFMYVSCFLLIRSWYDNNHIIYKRKLVNLTMHHDNLQNNIFPKYVYRESWWTWPGGSSSWWVPCLQRRLQVLVGDGQVWKSTLFCGQIQVFSSISGISITNDTTKRWLRGPFKMQTVLLWRKRSPYADITNKRTKLLYSYEDYIWLDILLYISLSDKDISGQMSARTGKVGRLGFQAQTNITRGPKVRRKYWRKN